MEPKPSIFLVRCGILALKCTVLSTSVLEHRNNPNTLRGVADCEGFFRSRVLPPLPWNMKDSEVVHACSQMDLSFIAKMTTREAGFHSLGAFEPVWTANPTPPPLFRGHPAAFPNFVPEYTLLGVKVVCPL